MEIITSKDNPKVKRARALLRRKERYKERQFLIEGVRLVEEALAKNAPLVEAFLTAEFTEGENGRRLAAKLEDAAADIYIVTEPVLKTLSETESPQGIVAVSRFVELALGGKGEEALKEPLYLVLDGVRDPGNVGTILRSAQAAGAGCVFLMKGTADPWSPKVVRSAMGAHFALPIRNIESLDELPPVDDLLVAEATGGVRYHDMDYRESVAIVVGGEAFGPEREARERATATVSIPMAGEAESLNAAIAASVILFEAAKQRSSF